MRGIRSSSGFITVGTTLALLAGIVAVQAGSTPLKSVFHLGSGYAWFGSNAKGQAVLVNGATGKATSRLDIPGAAGGQMHIVQRDGHAYVTVKGPGGERTLYRLDDTTLDTGAQRNVSPQTEVLRGGDTAYLIDSVHGTVNPVDPKTLTPSGKGLSFKGPILAAADDKGRLVVVDVPAGTASVIQSGIAGPSVAVGGPGDVLKVTTVGGVPAVIDVSKSTALVFTGGAFTKVSLPAIHPSVQVAADGEGKQLALLDGNVLYLVNVDTHATRTIALTFDATGYEKPLAAATAIFLVDRQSGAVVVVDAATGAIRRSVTVDIGKRGVAELFVKDGVLWLNNPDDTKAAVVHDDGSSEIIEKYRADIPKPATPEIPTTVPPQPPVRPPVSPPTTTGHTGATGTTVATGPKGGGGGGPPPPVATAPGAPGAFAGVAGNASVSLSWSAPANGGSPLTSYALQCTPDCGGGPVPAVLPTAQSTVVTGLKNGTAYSFVLTASNAIGAGPPAMAGPFTPTGSVPSSPSAVTAKANPDGTATVTWKADAQGLTLTGFAIDATSGDPAVSPSTLHIPVANPTATTFTTQADQLGYGLSATAGYTFTVTALADKNGAPVVSAPSPASNSISPYKPPTFDTGSAVTVSAGNQSLKLTWPAAHPNGRAVTYSVCSGPCSSGVTPLYSGGTAGTTLSGLSNGQAYTLNVVAHNAAGDTAKPITGSGTPHTAPTINITGAGTSSLTNGSVNFTVNGNGMPVSCSMTSPQSAGGNCSGYGFSVTPYNATTVTVCATNSVDPQVCTSASVAATIPPSQVVTVIPPSLKGFSNWAIRSQPTQASSANGSVNPGQNVTVFCHRTGTNPYGYSDQWFYVDHGGTRGWMSDGFYPGANGSLNVTTYCPPGV